MFYDGDGDGFGDPALSVSTCDVEAGHVVQAGDCDDIDARVHPDADEVCNERDDNCDGQVDEDAPASLWFLDTDGDGYGGDAEAVTACVAPEGYVDTSGDCDDGSAEVHPGMPDDTCDGVNNDCDDALDEDAEGTVWYLDADGDGYGTDADTVTACAAPEGYVDASGDCDEESAEVHPGMPDDTCDGVNNDCDEETDEDAELPTWYADTDGDGYGSDRDTATGCTAPDGYVALYGDCDEENAEVHPGMPDDTCDGVNNDCDEETDEDAVTSTWYADTDGDGYGVETDTAIGCTAPDGYAALYGDCDEGRVDVNPGASDDTCDGVNNDCDEETDEGAETFTVYRDADFDGVGDADSMLETCAPSSGYVPTPGDCDDSDPMIHPGLDEILDGKDNDCSSVVDDLTLADADVRFDGEAGEVGFGYAIATGHDVTSDGTSDFVIGSHSGSSVSIFSGALGAGDFGPSDVVQTVLAVESTDRFGSSLDLVGDYDGDGIADLVVGAPDRELGERSDSGEVQVFLGPFTSDGVAVAAHVYNDLSLTNLGATVIDAQQLTGLDTHAVGASFSVVGGIHGVLLFDSGPLSSAAKWQTRLVGDGDHDGFGESMGVMDYNGDGLDDLVVGAPGGSLDSTSASLDGAVYVFEGPLVDDVYLEDSVVSIFGSSDAELGTALSTDGDWDGDGQVDLLVGAPQTDAGDGEAFVVSLSGLSTGELIESVMDARLRGTVGELGAAVSLGGDVDGDGLSDALVGAPSFGDAHTESGAVVLFLGGMSGVIDESNAVVTGTAAHQYTGQAVAFAPGGFGDSVVIGAWGHDHDGGGSAEIDQGSAFVVESMYADFE